MLMWFVVHSNGKRTDADGLPSPATGESRHVRTSSANTAGPTPTATAHPRHTAAAHATATTGKLHILFASLC